MSTHAERAYAPGVLAALDADELAALDRFAARALGDPSAAPADDAERAAVRKAEALADRGASRLVRGTRRDARGNADPHNPPIERGPVRPWKR